MEKVNIVVLSEDMDLRIHIKNLIGSDDFAISGYSDFSSTGKLKSESIFPDVIICAVRGDVPDSVFQFVQQLLTVMHNNLVLLANDKITVELVNKAALYGIRKVLPLDDISPEDFTKEISRALALEQQRSLETNEGKKVRSKVVSFFGGKGGTGKTTFAVNTACNIAKMGKRVLLLDLDLQFGDVALALDLDTKYSIVDLVQDRGGITIENINNFVVEHGTGVSVLCAPKSPEFAEFVKPENIEKIIDVSRPFFEYIIIDLPPAFNDVSIIACENSEEIYMVYNAEILSLRNAKVSESVLEQLHQKDKLRIIVNKFEKGLITLKDFEGIFLTPVFFVAHLDTKAATISVNKGQPLSIAQPRSGLAHELENFTDRLVEIHTGMTPLTAKEKKKKNKLDAKIKKEKKQLEKVTAKESKQNRIKNGVSVTNESTDR